MEIKFTIPGNPFGKQRPYVANGHGFKRPKTIAKENLARESWNQVFNGKESEWNVDLSVIAYCTIPKSWPKWKQEAARLGVIRPNKKGKYTPDLDNVIKWVADSCNPRKVSKKTIKGTGIYADDGQIVHMDIDGWYSDKPRTEVTLTTYRRPTVEEIKQKVKEMKKDELQHCPEI